MISPIDRLLAIEDIKQLKARYFRFVDSHNWEGYRALFAADAVLESARPSGPDEAEKWAVIGDFGKSGKIVGADQIAKFAREGMVTAQSVHTGSMPEITILTPDTAHGIWAMEDIVRWPGRTLHGHGFYDETYVRRDGVWLFQTVRLVRKSLKIENLATTGGAIV